MKIHPNYLIITGAALLTGVISFAAINHHNSTVEVGTITDDINNAGLIGASGQNLSVADVQSLDAGSFPINFNDTNQAVYNTQVQLNRVYNAQIPLDGNFSQAMADVLCKNYWTTCFSWYPESTKEGSTYGVFYQTDYDNLVSKKSFS